VALCQARQRRILADVWASLAEGGLLVYSTCTFNRFENDLNVKWIAENLGADILTPSLKGFESYPGVLLTECGFSLVPGLVPGEGQYCAALRKTSPVGTARGKKTVLRHKEVRKTSSTVIPENLLYGNMMIKENESGIFAIPEDISEDASLLASSVRTLMTGCRVGENKGGFIPYSDLALCRLHNPDAFPSAELDLDTALAFLHRDSIVLPDAPKGYVLVTYGSLGLGFVKNLGTRCNNLHPMSRRIRMDVK
ncbi:MAG: rRNA cytosine-C5-methyltransferase, partial [Candidatus Cryptobacteroides sp.]